MSKYTEPTSLVDLLIKAVAGLFVILVLLWLCSWIWSLIWAWVTGAALVIAISWLLVMWRRWRNSRW